MPSEAEIIKYLMTTNDPLPPMPSMKWSGDPAVAAGIPGIEQLPVNPKAAAGIPVGSRSAGGGRGFTQADQIMPTPSTAPSSDPFTSLLTNVLSGGADISNLMMQTIAGQGAMDNQITGLQNQAHKERQTVVQQAMQVAGMNADIAYQQNSQFEQIQRIMGTDLADNENAIATGMQQFNEVEAARIAARAEYDELAGKDLFSDPLGYIMAQMELPKAAAKNNSLAAMEDNVMQGMRDRIALTAAAKSTLTANTADEIRARDLAQAQAKSQEAQASLYEEQAKNIADLGARQLRQIQTLSAAQRLKDEQEGRKEKAADLNSKGEEEALMNTKLAAVSATLGMPSPMTVKQLKTLGNAKERDWWLDAMNTGSFGPDLAMSVITFGQRANRRQLAATGGNALVVTADKIADAIQQSYMPQATQMSAAKNMGKPGKPAEVLSLAGKNYEDEILSAVENPSVQRNMASTHWDKVYNPYKAQHAAMIKFKAAELQNNSFAKYVDTRLKAGEITDGNLSSEDEQILLSTMAKDVIEGKIPPKRAAADVAAYYQLASQYNADMNKYDTFGLPRNSKYMFTVREAGTRAFNVDLMDPVQLENKLISIAAQRKAAGYDPTNPITKFSADRMWPGLFKR